VLEESNDNDFVVGMCFSSEPIGCSHREFKDTFLTVKRD